MSEAPYVVLTSRLERGPRDPSGKRTLVYVRGDKFPKPGDSLAPHDEAQLLAKNAIAKAATVSKSALDDANALSKIKRDMDLDKKKGKADAVSQTIEEEKATKGITDKAEDKKK